MGLLSAFVKGKMLQKALGGSGRAAQAGRGGGIFGRKMMIAAIAAMVLKRVFRR